MVNGPQGQAHLVPGAGQQAAAHGAKDADKRACDLAEPSPATAEGLRRSGPLPLPSMRLVQRRHGVRRGDRRL